MRAGKAYISSLGTTGLLIASSLLLLGVVGAFVAFDRWPDHAAADPYVVPIVEPPERDAEVTRSPTASAAASTADSRRSERGTAPTSARAAALTITDDGGSAPADGPAAIVKAQPAPGPVVAVPPAAAAELPRVPRPSAAAAPITPAPVKSLLPEPVDVIDPPAADPMVDGHAKLDDVTAPLAEPEAQPSSVPASDADAGAES